MDTSTATQILGLQAGSLLLLILTIVVWFRLRETPSGDVACVVVATCCAGLLYLSIQLLGPAGCVGGFLGIPGFAVYLWFLGLWGSRRSQSRLHQWGRRHGYRIVTIEPQYHPSRGTSSSGPRYRILARKRSDGQVLVGEVFIGPSGFQVHWIPVPPKHLPHGHRGAGPEVPNPPHAELPPPS